MSADAFMKLINSGRITEARTMLKSEMENAQFAPDKITIKDGIATFTRRGKKVEPDADGRWHLKR